MKHIVCVLSLFFIWPACMAEDTSTVIGALTSDGVFTVHCEGSNTLWSLEWAPDLDGEWIPTAFWNIPILNTSTNVPLSLRGLPGYAFFRAISSDQEIHPTPNSRMQTTDTNHWGSVSGKVMFWEGNFMPPGWGSITPVCRTLCFFEQTNSSVPQTGRFFTFILSPFISSTESNTNGDFSIALPAGDYSLVVIERPGEFYANLFDVHHNIWPIHVETNQSVEIQFNIDYLTSW